jgi:predicted NAD/FAD-dependent oxidoreductase
MPFNNTPRIAIIGAGLSGLILANALKHRAEVTVFEKARGVGGRMATRYALPYYFDHGTQYFTARDPQFKAFLAPLITQGVVAPWETKEVQFSQGKLAYDRPWFEPHYVAAPHMNGLCKALTQDIQVRTQVEIVPLTDRCHDGWELYDTLGQSQGVFAMVLVTAPAAQTIHLLGCIVPELSTLPTPQMQGCYTLMVGMAEPWPHAWGVARSDGNVWDIVSVNSSKPMRDKTNTCLVAQTTAAWAEAHIDDDMAKAEAFLLQSLEEHFSLDMCPRDYLSTHRWRYARLVADTAAEPCFDAAQGIGYVGDWCRHSRIEDTWLAADGFARRVLETLE